MFASVLNPHAEATGRYDDLVDLAVTRYGPRSQALAFLLYEELIALRTLHARPNAGMAVAARIAALRRQIQSRYDSAPFPPLASTPVRRLGGEPPLLEFDREIFEARYARVASAVRVELVQVDGPEPRGLRSGTPYMFVVDDHHRMIVWNRAFRFADLVFGRNRARIDDVPVAHPLLVPDRLRAYSAGEIVFIGDDRVEAVVCNTKSGHFRPPPSSGEAVRAICRDVLGLDGSRIDVFTVGSRPEPGGDTR